MSLKHALHAWRVQTHGAFYGAVLVGLVIAKIMGADIAWVWVVAPLWYPPIHFIIARRIQKVSELRAKGEKE